VFNIQKAVSRLPFAPPLNEIEVTDIKKGLGVFRPQPNKPVSFAAVKGNLKQAGYTLATADITVDGKLSNEAGKWYLVADTSGQKFALEGKDAAALASKFGSASSIEVTGIWTTVGKAPTTYESIDPQTIVQTGSTGRYSNEAYFMTASYFATPSLPGVATGASAAKRAPIRTTSPGLTVFKGGAVTPRFYLIKQHLGGLTVWRQALNVAVSYTPSPRVQLEVELPFSRTSFNDGIQNGSGSGLGNIIAWAKYRFFRKVKTYGDRQASARFGLELPTGKSSFPSAAQLNAPAFVRAQLGSTNEGVSPTADVSFSQAGGKVIFGGNIQGTYRTERDGFRIGHELRVNTDLEYVISPKHYPKPGGELFLILESYFITRSKGRVGGLVAPGSSSAEYYLAPGLQYAARPQFVIEGSIQLPVWRHDGAQVLRTDMDLLLGMKFLF
jgi:hypothetical protein